MSFHRQSSPRFETNQRASPRTKRVTTQPYITNPRSRAMPRKLTYRITHKGYIVEGKASSAQNACRLAFRKLIEAKLIKNQPETDPDSNSSFKDTKVEIINES